MKDISFLIEQLSDQLLLLKQKKYLPHWGPIYAILFEIKRIAKKQKQDIVMYQINDSAQLYYNYKKKRFIVQLPDIKINLKEGELADALISGKFSPKKNTQNDKEKNQGQKS